ncbi:hypothetical protein D3C85_1563570 [compost metagenome]
MDTSVIAKPSLCWEHPHLRKIVLNRILHPIQMPNMQRGDHVRCVEYTRYLSDRMDVIWNQHFVSVDPDDPIRLHMLKSNVACCAEVIFPHDGDNLDLRILYGDPSCIIRG